MRKLPVKTGGQQSNIKFVVFEYFVGVVLCINSMGRTSPDAIAAGNTFGVINACLAFSHPYGAYRTLTHTVYTTDTFVCVQTYRPKIL